jgi:hypothetical protein
MENILYLKNIARAVLRGQQKFRNALCLFDYHKKFYTHTHTHTHTHTDVNKSYNYSNLFWVINGQSSQFIQFINYNINNMVSEEMS